jgi:hypothetical protein
VRTAPSSGLLQKAREVSENYRALGTASAVLLHPDGTIASTLAQGADQIRGLVARLVAPAPAPNGNGAMAPAGAKPGEPVPAMRLPDLAGKTVDLAFRSPVLLDQSFAAGRALVGAPSVLEPGRIARLRRRAAGVDREPSKGVEFRIA